MTSELFVPEPGEIYDVVDTHQQERHPYVVVSRPELNYGDYCTVVPTTSRRFAERREFAYCVSFMRGEFGLTKNCVVRADQVVTIKKHRLIRPSRGRLSVEAREALVAAIGYAISAKCTYSNPT